MTRSTVTSKAMSALTDAVGALKARADAEYHGREVTLNKPMRNEDGNKKSKVYVNDPKSGKVKKVEFGDPDMSIKKNSKEHKASYCARSAGQGNTHDKTSANYWSRKAWNCD